MIKWTQITSSSKPNTNNNLEDTDDSIAWITDQSWSNGLVIPYGISAMGTKAVLTGLLNCRPNSNAKPNPNLNPNRLDRGIEV